MERKIILYGKYIWRNAWMKNSLGKVMSQGLQKGVIWWIDF